MTVLLILGQVVLGLYFIMSGANHFMHLEGTAGYAQSRGLGASKLLTVVSGIVMILGGLGVLLGVYVLWSLWMLIIFLVLAAFLVHHYWSDQDPMQKMGERVNFMKNLALAASLLVLTMQASAWPWSLFL